MASVDVALQTVDGSGVHTDIGPTNPLAAGLYNKKSSGTLGAALASPSGAMVAYDPAANSGAGNAGTANCLLHAVPDGHSVWSLHLLGTWDSASQVVFEGNDLAITDANFASAWYSLNGRRNSDQNTNESTNLLDVNPFGGSIAGISHWRGNDSACAYFRVRAQILTPGQQVIAYITSGAGTGAVFLNSAVTVAAPTGLFGQAVTVGINAVQLPVGQAGRKTVSLQSDPANGNNKYIYLGHASTLAAANAGVCLAPGDRIELDVTPTTPVWALSSSGSQTLRMLEVYG